MDLRYKKKENETDYEYGLRLIEIKMEEKPDDLEWADIVELLGLDMHRDSFRKSVVTGPYSGYNVMKYFRDNTPTQADKLQEIKEATIQLRDERNELNRKYREVARGKKFIDIFKDILSDASLPSFGYKPHEQETKPCSLVAVLSDIHYGHKVDSVYNTYNATVVQDRLTEYLDQLREITDKNKPEMTFLILGGDLISGSIHSLIRIENMENTVRQVQNISELLSSFTYELSKFSNKVMVFSVPGNHSRIFPKKEENAKGEYLDALVPFYMKAQLKDCSNVTIMDNQIDEEISCFRIYDHIFVATHGDKDSINTVVPNMERLLKVTPDVVIMGHRHSNGLLTHDRTKVIQNGCLCGMDNYTVTKRMVGYPEQVAFLVTADNPVKSLTNITFSAGRGVL